MAVGTHFTKTEIAQQGEIWKIVYNLILSQKDKLKSFLDPLISNPLAEAVFTGAGSSFFVGEMSAGVWQYYTGMSAKAVGTTEIVTHPQLYLHPEKPVLLVSFARSGNSPESKAAVSLSERVSSAIHHLIITCNASGDLANMGVAENRYILVLPEETNDKGLAMTSSVSSMYLTALLIAQLDVLELLQPQVEQASYYAQIVAQKYNHSLEYLSFVDFKRAVFLGSGMFLGLAREAHLKLQELTAGKIICKFDSFLGFRHGPKVVVNRETLVVFLFSNDEYVNKYERDLARSFRGDNKPIYTLGISEKPMEGVEMNLNIFFALEEEHKITESFLMLPYLVVVQLLAYFKSLGVGLNPDSPSKNGVISRVVQGVTIYPFEKNDIAINLINEQS